MSENVTYRWEVRLDGHNFDLEDVAAVLQPQGYILQQHDDNEWYLSGPVLEDESTAGEAQRRAGEIVHNVNAVLLVRNPKHRLVTVGSAVREGDEVHAFIQAKAGILRMKVKAVLTDASGGTESQPLPFEGQRRWLAAAEKDLDVQAILDLVASGREDYDLLYRAFERIKDDLGGDAESVRNLMGWSKPKFNGFCEAVNAPRHENPNRAPRMDLSEATELGRDLIRVWLNHKTLE